MRLRTCKFKRRNDIDENVRTGDSSAIVMSKDFVTAVTIGVGMGFVIGWIFRGRYARPGFLRPLNGKSGSHVAGESGDYKLILVVRTDLKMGKGKIAAQCAHAAVHAAETMARNNPEHFMRWKRAGQPKVVVKTESQESLTTEGILMKLGRDEELKVPYKEELAAKAKSLGLNASLIRDAGRTQIAPGSVTVLGVGPGPDDLVNSVTGHLKLY